MKSLPPRRRLARGLTTRVVLGALLAVPVAAGAQARHSAAADTLIELAHAKAQVGDTSAALDLLQRATRVAPDYAPAFYERAVLLSRTTRLGMSDVLRRHTASEQLKRALDLDANNPFYLMELGRLKLKTPFLRLDAERMFNKALKAAEDRKDPRVLGEVHAELGQVFERRYASTAHRRMIVGIGILQFNPDLAVSDWRDTRDFLEQHT